MPLIEHPAGNYAFLPGIAPYSCGVVSSRGYELVHVTLQTPVGWRAGFDRISQYLASQQRPKTALCSVALRSPRPYSFSGFAEFNLEYASTLKEWGVFVNGVNPIARTNVAPVVAPPTEPSLYGFSFSRPCAPELAPTFVVAGAGELPEGVLARDGIISHGDISPKGITSKAVFVMGLMESRLHGLGLDWAAVSMVNIYTAHEIMHLLPDVVLKRMGKSAIHGIHWHFSHPPVAEIEYEMDMRGTRTDLRI